MIGKYRSVISNSIISTDLPSRNKLSPITDALALSDHLKVRYLSTYADAFPQL